MTDVWPTDEALAAVDWEDDSYDLSSCPYYRSEGTCGFDCPSWMEPEPHCITSRPRDGWPSERVELSRLEHYGRTDAP